LGLPLVREYTSFTLDGEERFCIDSIEAFPRVGIDKQAAADLSNASVTLQMSRDGGFTWGAEKPRDVGVTGAYATRLTWRALGQYRTATARFTLSSEADIPLLASINLGMS
jgi:hypothetical protein